MNTAHKYGPTSVDEFLYCDEHLERTVRRYVTGKTILPLILYGRHGTGKSCLAELIPKSIDGDDVSINWVNAEDLNNSAEVRKQFLRSGVFDKFFPLKDQSKYYTVIEEVNFESKAKGVLRVCIDRMGSIDLMIFTTNEIEKIDKGLISRAEVVEVLPLKPEQFLPRAREILASEGVSYKDSELIEVLESVYELHSDNREYYKALDIIIDAANDEAKTYLDNLDKEQA